MELKLEKNYFRILVILWLSVVVNCNGDVEESTSEGYDWTTLETATEAVTTDEPGGHDPIPSLTSLANQDSKGTSSTPKVITEKPKATEDPNSNRDPGPFCSCDLTEDECEVNCCCDPDCSELDRTVFGECLVSQERAQEQVCLPSHFIFANNSGLPSAQSERGVLCLATDNLPSRLSYLNQQIVRTEKEFNKIIKRKKQFTWITKNPLTFSDVDLSSPYIAETPILIFSRNSEITSFSKFKIVSPMTSPFCQGSQTLKYLKNLSTKCFQRISKLNNWCQNNEQLNAAVLFNITFLRSPNLINVTNLNLGAESAGVKPEVKFYEKKGQEINGSPQPVLAETLCKNVLEKADCTIIHNGTSGILAVNCSLQVTNVSLIEGSFFEQSFSFSFKWNKTEENIFERSGRPGYITGKPLISGVQVTKWEGNTELKAVKVSRNKRDWISLLTADQAGACSSRTLVLFNQNIRTECLFTFDKNLMTSKQGCKSLQSNISQKLLGSSEALLVSSFGDPSPEDIRQWVPVLSEPMTPLESCDLFSNFLAYRVLFTLVGSLVSPQPRLVAVTAQQSTGSPFCQGSSCRLKLISSVIFTDVSKPAVSQFAEAPMVKIRLPYDFFYPFSSSADCLNKNIFALFFIILSPKFFLLFY